MAASTHGFASLGSKSGYPSALTIFVNSYDSGFRPRSVVELKVIEMEATIREKENWWSKVNDPEIVGKWRQELMDHLGQESEQTEVPTDPEYQDLVDHLGQESEQTEVPTDPEYQDLMEHLSQESEQTEVPTDPEYQGKMVDYAIKECSWQAEQYREGPVRLSAVDGVFVRDDLDENLRMQLLRGISELRSRPAIGTTKEDRHPGTPEMVDLVHPSMYAYERGKTMVIPGVGAEATKMPEWFSFLGKDGILEEPLNEIIDSSHPYSSPPTGLQWLPSEFQVVSSGDLTKCEINSYINSLHPIKDADLYNAISSLFCHSVPLLEEVLAEAGEHEGGTAANGYVINKVRDRALRIPMNGDWWDGELRDQEPGELDDDYSAYMDQNDDRKFIYPEMPEFKGPPEFTCHRAQVNLRNVPLQVIVKIASLELEPDEWYEGGVWHVEGTLGERIVATACCYLELDNVSGGELAFRTSVAEPSYEQYDREGVKRMYNLEDEKHLVQRAGSCITRQGRILAWPNTKQHKVDPVHLINTEKPGKRTICCFFLVDPKLRIRSTATVPPQQLAWVANDVVKPAMSVVGGGSGGGGGMSEDVFCQVMEKLASPSLLTYEASCERRERLMDERRGPDDEDVDEPIVRPFSLCEH